MTKKNEQLTTSDSFAIASRYDGMSEEDKAELQDEMEDLDDESGINCRTIKIPAGGKIAFEVQGDEDGDEEYPKEIEGVILFTHRMNGYWSNAFGDSTNPDDKSPACSSMDGKTGIDRATGEVRSCDTCPYNQFGSDSRGKGKACKNMRRIYLMRSGDPNLYLLTVPPTSIKEVNKTLTRIMASSGIPYTRIVLAFGLKKAKNAAGIDYSTLTLEKRLLLKPAVAERSAALRKEIKTKYKQMSVSLDDYAPPAENSGSADERSLDVTVADADFTEVKGNPEDDIIPF